jgi:hypothetical protein
MDTEIVDSEIQDCAEEITGALAAAFDILIERREVALAAAIAPLDEERASLLKEHASIGEAAQILELVLPAQAREAQREADRLTVAGLHEEAKAKFAEMQENERAPEVMRARQSEISARIEAVEGEKKASARRVFESWYADVQTVIRAVERGLFCTLLDGLKASFSEYQERTGTGGTLDRPYSYLVKDAHISNLTADERSAAWNSGSRWYGGRRR